MPSKVWDEITYTFPNINGSTVEVWEWISEFTPHFIMDAMESPYNRSSIFPNFSEQTFYSSSMTIKMQYIWGSSFTNSWWCRACVRCSSIRISQIVPSLSFNDYRTVWGESAFNKVTSLTVWNPRLCMVQWPFFISRSFWPNVLPSDTG